MYLITQDSNLKHKTLSWYCQLEKPEVKVKMDLYSASSWTHH